MPKIVDLRTDDVRFPTSEGRHGSDAMNPDPDYSAAYVQLITDDSRTGYGLAFTLGRGTDLCAQAIAAHRDLVVGQTLESFMQSPGTFYRHLTGDSQLRWLGPEKGVIHLAAGAILNAFWDLYARFEQKPLWQLLCDMTPEQIVDSVDFRYLTDALTPDDGLSLLHQRVPSRDDRRQAILQDGYPAYTTSVGWLGYSDDELVARCRQAIREGWTAAKLKVGGNLQRDIERLTIARREFGPEMKLMLDANQVWDVPQAIEWMNQLAAFDPVWIEEPTCPDDILGHAAIAQAIAPIGVATGEVAQNRVTFKQLLQANAIQYCQIDSCRLGGVNEVIAVLLMAAKFGVPVCPHGGGVGLCEHIQHLAIFDYVAVSGSLENRWTEFVDHLHEHFVEPCRIRQGRYLAPTRPGYSIEMKPASIEQYRHQTA